MLHFATLVWEWGQELGRSPGTEIGLVICGLPWVLARAWTWGTPRVSHRSSCQQSVAHSCGRTEKGLWPLCFQSLGVYRRLTGVCYTNAGQQHTDLKVIRLFTLNALIILSVLTHFLIHIYIYIYIYIALRDHLFIAKHKINRFLTMLQPFLST